MRRRAPLVATALVALSCGGGQGAKAPGAKTDETAAPVRKVGSQGPVKGHMLASIPERAIGPFAARHPDGRGGLVAWVTPAEGQGRRVVAIALGPNGEPKGPERTIAFASVETTALVVRTMRGPAPGFVVTWTALTDRGESLWAAALGDDATPRGKPVELARTNDDVAWVDVVPTDLGAVCLWAEETRGGDANVVAAALDTDGKVRGVPARVARGVTGWHALAVPGGVGLSTVSGVPKARGGTLAYQKLDLEGRVQGEPVTIASKPTVSGDVEVVRDRGRLVFAWTDRTADEPVVAGATLADDGKVEPPRKIVEGRGGAGLLGMSAGQGGVGLLWESPVRRGGTESRKVYTARMGAALAPEGRAVAFEAFGRAAPEIAAVGGGFSVSLPARDCTTDPSCPVVASVTRLDPDFTVAQRDALAFSGDPAALAWGLSCGEGACYALAASGGGPTRVRSVTVAVRSDVRPAAPASPASSEPSHVVDVAAIVSGESVSDIAAAKIGEQTLVAMLSQKPDAKGQGLTLSTRILGSNAPPVVLSTRALAVGGVAIAQGEKPEDGGVVGWVARENGDPEVHVTRIDKNGKRTNDVQLTTTKGDASDVTLTWAGGGWIVAWIDGRDGNSEVYATKIGLDLARIAREERITNAPGDASDLAAIAHGDQVWLAWGDARESPKDGMADVWLGAVKMRDAKKVEDERRLYATAAHSRSPQLAAAGDGVAIAWIEESPLGLESPGAAGHGAMWATLDGKGKVATQPSRVPAAGEGAATSIALEPGAPLRAVVARATPESIALDGVLLGPSPRAFPLLTLDGPPSMDVALLLHEGLLFFNDDGPTAQDKRARRARIDWAR